MRHESQGLWQADGSRRDLSRRDHGLDPAREPPLGAHLVTPRRGYTHHGIYVGRGRVVQYGGLSHGLRRGPVEEVALLQFARGRPIWLRLEEPRQMKSCIELVRGLAKIATTCSRITANISANGACEANLGATKSTVFLPGVAVQGVDWSRCWSARSFRGETLRG
jgi:hypothetical protein